MILGPGFYAILIVLILVILLAYIFFLISLQKTLELIEPKNRRMKPGNVWLLLIPVFGNIYQFIVVGNIARSIAAEFNTRGLPLKNKLPGNTVGMLMSALFTIGFIASDSWLIPLSGVGGFLFWIVYWIEIAEHRKKLQSSTIRL